jgi:uncharacterized protein (TIGR02391 family)
MDHEWALKKLMDFATQCDQATDDENHHTLKKAADDKAQALQPVAQRIMNAYEAGLGEYEFNAGHSLVIRWRTARPAAMRAAGLAENYEALQRNLKPDAPYIAADGLHEWVWEAARPMWEADARQEAVNTAARAINARIQQKSGRHDIGEHDLVMQVFDTQDPKPGKPRLRLPGDRSKPSWKSQQEGVKFFGAGCFRAIRNPAAHEETVSWSEQEALEYLAALSALARWVELSTIETAE